jgi:Family of unknown function (DUF5686)/CarboxypepD_reg-like domain
VLRKYLLSIILLLLVNGINAQMHTISGKIVDAQLQPVAFASVYIKGQETATTSDAKGKFNFRLMDNRYEIIITMIGYKTNTTPVILNGADEKINIILEKASNTIQEIKITNRKKDNSEDIIKNVIARKEQILNQTKCYNLSLYIKAIQTNNTKPIKLRFGMLDENADSIKIADSINFEQKKLQGMSMAEIVSNIDFEVPNKIKETRLGVKKNGNIDNLFYLHITDGDFNFYKNLITIPSLSAATFLSPISYSGLLAYKYKTISITEQNGRKIYRIKVTPTKTGNALLEGEITVIDSLWYVRDFHLSFPKHLLPEYSNFQVSQTWGYAGSNDDKWLPIKQSFVYNSNSGKKFDGTTTLFYQKYITDTLFEKKHFGMEVSTTTDEAYERDSSFWNNERAEPLSEKELKFIAFKDSIYNQTHSQTYFDSIDKKTNTVTFKKIFWDGVVNYNRVKDRRITINPVPSFFRIFQLGGPRITPSFFYNKKFKNYQRLNMYAETSYGANNKDVQGNWRVGYLYNPFSQGKITTEVGRNTEALFNGDALVNLLSRASYYLNTKAKVIHNIEVVNGLYIENTLEIAHRSDLADYKLYNNIMDSFFIKYNIPLYGGSNRPLRFAAYNDLYTTVKITYTPGQKYIREPRQKIVLGSAYPSIYLKYRKGIKGVFGSVVDFDYIEFGLNKEINWGTVGTGKLYALYGNYLRSKRLERVDYKWLPRGQFYVFFNPETSFQSLDSTIAVFKGYTEGHYYHQFNGAIINKIPMAKNLKLFESGGFGYLILPERNLRYVEAYFGLEKQITILGSKFKIGGFLVSSYANQYQNPLQFKIGIRQYNDFLNRWE